MIPEGMSQLAIIKELFYDSIGSEVFSLVIFNNSINTKIFFIISCTSNYQVLFLTLLIL